VVKKLVVVASVVSLLVASFVFYQQYQNQRRQDLAFQEYSSAIEEWTKELLEARQFVLIAVQNCKTHRCLDVADFWVDAIEEIKKREPVKPEFL